MSNNKQTNIAELAINEYPFSNSERNAFINGYNKAKLIEKQQAEHYATFITNCVINNLPTITFNDWINLHNNEQQ